jgi:nuclear RNA export factor
VSTQFTPEEFHICGQTAAFFIREQRAADELRKVSHTIQTRDGSTLAVNVKPSTGPLKQDSTFAFSRMDHQPRGERSEPLGSVTLSGHMTSEQEDILKLALGNRYDSTYNSLNLSDFYHDEVLQTNGIRGILNRPEFLDGLLQIVHENCPELVSLDLSNNRLTTLDGCVDIGVKLPNLHQLGLANNVLRSEAELDKLMRCPKLVAISLEGNPFVLQLSGNYASTVQSRLPNITSLDGQQLAPKIGFDLPTKTALPEVKPDFAVNPQIKQVVYKFLETYYGLYDTPGGREKLLDAYTDDALFSLAVGSLHKQPHK